MNMTGSELNFSKRAIRRKKTLPGAINCKCNHGVLFGTALHLAVCHSAWLCSWHPFRAGAVDPSYGQAESAPILITPGFLKNCFPENFCADCSSADCVKKKVAIAESSETLFLIYHGGNQVRFYSLTPSLLVFPPRGFHTGERVPYRLAIIS